MKNYQNHDIRLTDSLERELLKNAIKAQHQYEFERKLKLMFKKLIGIFTGPEVRVHNISRTAAN